MMERLPVLTMILLAPLAGVLVLCFLPRGRQDKARRIAAAVMGIGFCLTLWVYSLGTGSWCCIFSGGGWNFSAHAVPYGTHWPFRCIQLVECA